MNFKLITKHIQKTDPLKMQRRRCSLKKKKLTEKVKVVKGSSMIPSKEKFTEAQEKGNCNGKRAL